MSVLHLFAFQARSKMST